MSWMTVGKIALLIFFSGFILDVTISGIVKTYFEHKTLSEKSK